MVETFLPIYFKSISITDKGVGFLVGIFAASSSITFIPVGFASDRFSPCFIIRSGVILFIIYILGLIWFDSLINLSIFTIIGGLGSTFINIGLSTIFYKGLEEKVRGSMIGSFFLSSSAGYSLGPLSAGYLLHRLGPQSGSGQAMQAVFLAGIICISILFVLSFIIKEKCVLTIKSDNLEPLDYISIFRQHKAIFLLISVSVVGIHLGAEQSSLSIFFKMNLNLSDKSIGTIYALVGIWVGLLAYISGRVFDHSKNVIFFIWTGMIISGVFQIATAYTNSYWDALIMRMLHTAGDSFILLCNGILTSIIFKERHMGSGVGVVQGFRSGSIFLSAVLCGLLNGMYGYHINFIITGVLSLLSGFYVLFLERKLQLLFYDRFHHK